MGLDQHPPCLRTEHFPARSYQGSGEHRRLAYAAIQMQRLLGLTEVRLFKAAHVQW